MDSCWKIAFGLRTGRNTLRQERIARQFSQLRRPEIARDYLVFFDPVRVDVLQQLDCLAASWCVATSDQNTIWPL